MTANLTCRVRSQPEPEKHAEQDCSVIGAEAEAEGSYAEITTEIIIEIENKEADNERAMVKLDLDWNAHDRAF